MIQKVLIYIGCYAVVAVITLIIAIWSSKNPNTLKCFGNDIRPPYDLDNDQVLNDEYECGEDDGC